jgi:hypothetical protein
MSEWQDIETAPKNGTEILIYREDCGVILARWVAPCEFLHESEYISMSPDSWEEADWFGADFVSGYRVSNDGLPTHWQPLPEPPSKAKQAEETI